jgi:hypothetical protein
MEALGHTPFAHALALAWADDRLTANEFRQLDALQQALGLSDSEREVVESVYEEALTGGRASPGEYSASLVEWIDAVRALTGVHTDISSGLARRLGATALRAGLTQKGWTQASDWMDGLGLLAPFAEGCWMEGGAAPALQAVPLALAPAAAALDLLDD